MVQLARFVVEAVVREGRSCREVARAHGVSKSWVAKVVARYRKEGEEALRPRSRAPHRTPHRVSPEVEERVVRLRKRLSEQGFDAGAATIHYHLSKENGCTVPSVSTIWRVLRRRGFVTPQPHKRPRSSWIRFEAQLPNECWQSDVTSWRLAGGTPVEIVNFLDDHSRLVTASRVLRVATATDVLHVFRSAAERWGLPAAILTDNGCVYTAWHRGGATAMEVELVHLGIEFRHSRPGHPQTCGKVERFHQTLKRYLASQPKAASIAELQRQVDRFIRYYNETRPHRARGRMTPRAAFEARDRARPSRPAIERLHDVRVRQDRISAGGTVSLRYRGRLHHIGVGRDHRRKRVTMLIFGLEVRIITRDGELLRRLTLDPKKTYHGTGRPPGPPKGRPLGSRKASTMS
ncbi:MAG: IS481 family transposase [Actinomycetota bacterium]